MLLNNYYITTNNMGYLGYLNTYGTSNFSQYDYSIDKILKLKLGSGYTLKQLSTNGDIKLSSNYDSGFNYSTLVAVDNRSFNSGDLAGSLIIGFTNANSGNSDAFKVAFDSTSYNTRSPYLYRQMQGIYDLMPAVLRYMSSEYDYHRVSDIVRVAGGVDNDSTPVTLNDYSLSNMYDLDDVSVTYSSVCNGLMVITLTNNTNSNKTIREIGIFNNLLKAKVLYDDYDNGTSVTIPDLTSGQKEVVETALAKLTDFTIKYNNINETSSSQYGYIDIPILVSKTKLTTPIVLQPGETKAITYEIKWN